MLKVENGVAGALMEQRLHTLATLISTYASATPVTEIAVVGNAPVDESAERASRIDSCDVVVRMTSFRVDGDTPALGSRTDVVALHRGTIATPWTFERHASRLYILVEPGRRHWEPAIMPHWWPADLGLVRLPNDLFSDRLVDDLGLSRDVAEWGTTGTLMAWAMTTLFPDAHLWLAGFSIVDQPDQASLQHAWGGQVPVTAEHRLGAEAQLLSRMAAGGRLTLLA